jgi:branched-chain amino acid transport system substrate-binding protein
VRASRLGVAATLLALTVIAAGCASPGSGIQAGEHVTVYVSMPLHGPEAADGLDVADGAKLALADAHGKVGKLAIRAVYLDDASADGPRPGWSPAKAAANARRATEDSTAIAYVGDFDSGATRFSLPITNEARMLQVSPASAAVDLVQPYLGAGDQVPDVQRTGERTFGRVIPSDEVQGEAGAVWAKRLGAKRPAVGRCGSAYSRVVGSAFRAEARSLGLEIAKPGAANNLEYLTAEPSSKCTTPHTRGAPVMGTDALFETVAGGTLPGKPGNQFLTSAAQDPKQLPPRGQRFLRAFRSRYRRAPGRYAAYGYEAMAVVLDSIRRAGSGGEERDSVVSSFFDGTDRNSILGTYSIDDVGDTTLDRLAGYRIVNGRPAFDTALRVPP